MSLENPRRPVGAVLGALACLALAGTARGDDRLTLRANDAIAQPGGVAAIVLRTYAPRPVGVGQICLRTGPGGQAPFARLEGHTIFSEAGDVISAVDLRTTPEGGQEVVVEFESPSGTANLADGPLAVLYLRLADGVQVDQRFAIDVDAGNTVLFGPGGDPITVRGRSGDLRVRAPGAPFLLEAEGDSVEAGETAELGIETFEPFAVGSGRLVLRWPRGVAASRPTVLVDPRHGAAVVSVHATRRKVRVDLESADGSFNSVPGAIVRVFLELAGDLERGDEFRVWIGDRTHLIDPLGQDVQLELESDQLEIE